MAALAVCIDVTGSKRAMDIAFCKDGSLQFSTMSSVPQFCKWVKDNNPRIIAVDAPSKRNCGRVAQSREAYGIPERSYDNFRVVEAILRTKEIGLYNTPIEKPPPWMSRGWDLYESLMDVGYVLLDRPGHTSIADDARTVIEVHPHASFVVGLDWIPQTKKDLAGQIERMAYLRAECAQLNVKTTGTPMAADPILLLSQIQATWDSIFCRGLALPMLSHDQLDACVGLTTAIRAVNGQAFAVGDSEDGVIVLPKQLSQTPYRRLPRA